MLSGRMVIHLPRQHLTRRYLTGLTGAPSPGRAAAAAVGAAQAPEEVVGVDAGLRHDSAHRTGVDGMAAVISQGNLMPCLVHHMNMAASLPGPAVAEPLQQGNGLGECDIAD